MRRLLCCIRPATFAEPSPIVEQQSLAGPANDRATCRSVTPSSSTETPALPLELGSGCVSAARQQTSTNLALPRAIQQNFRFSDECTAASAFSTAPTSPSLNPFTYFLPLVSDEQDGLCLDADALGSNVSPQPSKLEFADLCGSLEDLTYLGEGSNGVVYSASWHGARVAVKFLLTSDGDSAHLNRCFTEAVLTRVLSHPCVVQCFATAISQLSPGVWDAIRARCQRHRSLLRDTSLARSVAAAVQQEAAGGLGAPQSSEAPPERQQSQPQLQQSLLKQHSQLLQQQQAAAAAAASASQQQQQQRGGLLSRRGSGRESNPRDRSGAQLQRIMQQQLVVQQQQQQQQQQYYSQYPPPVLTHLPRSQPQLVVATVGAPMVAGSSSRLSSASMPRRPMGPAAAAPREVDRSREDAGDNGGGRSSVARSCDAEQVLLEMRRVEGLLAAPVTVTGAGAAATAAAAGPLGADTGSSPCPSPFRLRPCSSARPSLFGGPLGPFGALGPCPSLDRAVAGGSVVGVEEEEEAVEGGELCEGGEGGGVSVVQALTWLRAGEGRHCTLVVMEYMDAGTLHTAICRGDFSARRSQPHRSRLLALLLTAQELAQGMAHLHGLDILHGDLKPTNVLLKACPCQFAPAPLSACASTCSLSTTAGGAATAAAAA
ncbi:hypothetical protein Agub_g557, partial [Astrephomene gubernaculifera]